MNQIYKVIWNAATQSWVAVSELSRVKGKTKSKKLLSAAVLAAVSGGAIVGTAEAAVTGTEVGNGVALGIQSSAYNNGVAVGNEANTNYGHSNIAVGYRAKSGTGNNAASQSSIAIGYDAVANTVASVVIGADARVVSAGGSDGTGNFATAIGAGARVHKDNGSAFGQGANATGVYATALGKSALAKEDYSIALGKEAQANTQLSTSVGTKANATGQSAIAIGSSHVPAGNTVIETLQGAQATADDAMAIGASALASQRGATALGKLSNATGENSTALGADSEAKGIISTAVGKQAKANSVGSSSFGTNTSSGYYGSAVGVHAKADGSHSTALGSESNASATGSSAVGNGAKASGENSTSIGRGANAVNRNSLAAGAGALARGAESIAMGLGSNASGASAVTIGQGSLAAGTDSSALGRGAGAWGNYSTAVGRGASARADNSLALGSNSSVSSAGGVALGDGATSTRSAVNKDKIGLTAGTKGNITGTSSGWSDTESNISNANASDSVYAPVRLIDDPSALERIAGTIKGNKGAVSVGDDNNTRQIINVAAGSADSDAVNVAQLKAVAGQIRHYNVTGGNGITVNPTNSTNPDTTSWNINIDPSYITTLTAWHLQDALENGTNPNNATLISNQTVTFKDSATIDVVRDGSTLTFNAKNLKYFSVNSNAAGNANNDGAKGTNSIAIGPNARASGAKNSTALGSGAVTDSESATAIGSLAQGRMGFSVAMGTEARALGTRGTAIGNNSTANSADSMALGTNTYANGAETIAMGPNAYTSASRAIAMGYNAQSTQGHTVTLGESAKGLGENAVTIGINSASRGVNAVTIGNGATTGNNETNNDYIAKSDAYVAAEKDYANKRNAYDRAYRELLNGGNQAAITELNRLTGNQSDSLNALTRLNASTSTNSAVATVIARANDLVGANTSLSTARSNLANATGIDGRNAIAIGSGSLAQKADTIAMGRESKATEVNAIALGLESQATKKAAVALGYSANATGNASVAIGGEGEVGADGSRKITEATGNNAVAIGTGTKARKLGDTAMGYASTADAGGATALGYEANALGTYSVALGAQARVVADATSGAALGPGSRVEVAQGVALGLHSVADTAAGVTGHDLAKNRTNKYNNLTNNTNNTLVSTRAAVSVGGGSSAANPVIAKRQITDVAAGTEDTDAVNVAQLRSVSLQVGADNAARPDLLLETGRLDVKGDAKSFTETEAKQNGTVAEIVVKNTMGTLNSTVANNGKINPVAKDGVASLSNVVNAINASGWTISQNGTEKGLVQPGDGVDFANGRGTTVTVDGTSGTRTVKVNANVASVVSGDSNVNITTGDDGVVTIKANNTQATVTAGSGVTVSQGTANSNGTANYTVAVNVDNSTITVNDQGQLVANVDVPDVSKTDLTVNHTGANAGKIDTPADGDKGKLVTAENVAKAINESYWKANAAGNVDADSTVTVADNVTAGTEVLFSAGKNLKVKHDANNFTFATEDDVTFNNVTSNNMTTGNLTVNNGGKVDMGGNKVENVANGTISNTSTDAVNGSQLYAVDQKFNNTVRLGSENGTTANQTLNKEGGLQFNVNGSGTDGVLTTEANGSNVSVKYNGTAAAAVTNITYKANGDDANEKTVSLKDGLDFTNGNHTNITVGDNGVVKVDVNTTALSNTTTDGKITVPNGDNSNGLVTAKDVANAINAAHWNLNVGGATVQNVKAGDFVNFANGRGTTVEYTTAGELKVNANVASVVSGDSNVNITTGDDGVVTIKANNTQATVTAGSGVTVTPGTANSNGTANYTVAVNVDDNTIKIGNDGKLFANITMPDVSKTDLTVNNTGDDAGKVNTPAEDDKGKLVTAENVAKAINESYWKAAQGAHVETNTESENQAVSNITAGETLTFASGKNLALQKDGNTFIYATKDDVSFNNVTSNNITTGNLTVSGDNATVDMGGSKVRNVQDGNVTSDSKEAVNGSQLYAVDQKFNNTVRLGSENGTTANQTLNKAGGLQFNVNGSGTDGVLTTEANGSNVSVKYNGTAAAAVTNISYKANGGDAKQVSLKDGLDFTNGNHTNITVDDNGVVKVDVNTTALSNTTTDGKITVPTGDNSNGLVTAKDVANAINAANWKLNVNGENKQSVKAGDIVNFANGRGTVVEYTTAGELKVNANVASVVSGDSNVNITTGDDGVVTIKANNTQATVTAGSGVTVTPGQANSNGTANYTVAVNVDDNTIKIGNDGKLFANITMPDVSKTDLTVNNTGDDAGKVNTPAEDDKGKLVTAENVAKAINESYWKAAQGAHVETNTESENQAVSNITAGETLTFASGKNLALQKDGNTFIYATKDDVSFNNVTSNNITTGNLTVSGDNATVDMGGNQVTNVAEGTKGTDAVNVNQLNNTIANSGWNLTVNNGTNVSKVLPNATVDFRNTDGNVDISKADNNITINLNPNTTFGVKGEDGKDGVDGSIGVNGKDGASVVINGKDGSIGLTGPKGADGKDGASANISVENGTTTVNNDRDGGNNITRIVYTDKDKDGNDIKREVATLDDGLKFKGDSDEIINRTLGSQMNITGGANATTLTDKNIGVVYDAATNGLKVKLAKDLDLTPNGSVVIGNSTLKDNGFTITNGTNANNTVSLTDKGLNNGNNTITNVAPGVNGTDAVNVNQLNSSIANSGWSLTVNNGTNVSKILPNATVDFRNTDGNVNITKADNNITINLNPNTTFGVKGEDGKDGVDGSIGVNGKDGASVVINGKDGSIGLTGPKGADGKDGASANISVENGTTTVNNDRDGGNNITRIVYTDKDKDGNDIKREVATLDDGLKFKGDSDEIINRTLGSQMNITGGANATTLTDKNIGVVYDAATNGLKVKLAKDLDLTPNGSVVIGNSTLKDNGFTITNGTNANNTVSLTDKGLNNGNNVITNVSTGVNGTDAVNVDQLNSSIANSGWSLTVNNGTNVSKILPNATVDFRNTDGNVNITKAGNNITINVGPKLDLGKDGKDGELIINGGNANITMKDGVIGANGTNGASVVINGKDGSIGLTGPKGADGKDGASANISVENGTTTVNNDRDGGNDITRIVYTDKDKDGNDIKREVATLDDGLKFKGDSDEIINRTLGSQMNITGGANATTLTDKNIGVVYDAATNGLKVKLAKDLDLTPNGSVVIGNSTLKDNGFTITNGTNANNTVSLTDKGLNNGNNVITNVSTGVNGTDAVNVDQLNSSIANSGWSLTVNNGTNVSKILPNATVDFRNTDGNVNITKAGNNITINVGPKLDLGKDGKDGELIINGGNANITMKDGVIGANGTNGAAVVINGKDGSIGLTGPKGADGKDGASANITVIQGPAGVDGKDGETTTRLVVNGANVSTLNDGLKFTGNNEVVNTHKLNTLVTIVGEGVDKAASANFTSASGNINVKADGNGKLEVQLAKDLKNIDTISNGNATITLNKDGGTTISGGDVSVDGNKVTNVKDGDITADSKDAVNGSQLYHVMTNATAGWNLSVNNGTFSSNVKPGASVDFNNTDGNVNITKAGNNITVNVGPKVTLGKDGKDGELVIQGNGTSISMKDGVIGANGTNGSSVVINGKDGSIGLTGPKGADGKDGASANISVDNGTTTVNERDGGNNITRIVYTDKDKDGNNIKREVATLDDGLKFKGDSKEVINRTLGSQMNITGGADSNKLTENNIGVVYDKNTNGLKVKLSKDVNLGEDGSITVGGTNITTNGLTIKDGPSITKEGVDAGNKKVTNVADGDINATSKDAVNGSQLYQAVNNINNNVSAAKTEVEAGDNVTITSRKGNNGQTIYKVSTSLTDTSAHVNGSDAVSVTKADKTRKVGSTTVTDYNVDLSQKTKDDIKKGVDAHDTVTNKGLTFNADKGTTGAKKLGSQVAVNGDNKNIETVADTNGVKVKLKDDINVNSVTAKTVNANTVNVAAKDDAGKDTAVVINQNGINAGGTRIQNVAAGKADTDAVNVSQLKGAVTNINNQMNKMDRNLRAGVAGAMAAGGLYHATLPGKSMVAAGAGTYKGESAVAVGYSRLSDNGKIGIKFSVNTNTRGDAGASASVGYQW